MQFATLSMNMETVGKWIVLLLVAVFGDCNVNGSDECMDVGQKVQTVYNGWPTTVDCVELFEVLATTEDGGYSSFTCKIEDSATDELLWTMTNDFNVSDYFMYVDDYIHEIIVDDDTKDSTYRIILRNHNEDICAYQELVLKKTRFKQLSCEESYKMDNPRNICFEYKQLAQIEPAVLAENSNVPMLNPYSRHISTYWIKDCNMSNPFPQYQMTSNKNLIISPVSFKDIGQYTYVASRNGQKRFLMHANVSVKAATSKAQVLAISCNKITKTRVGSDAVLNCRADLGVGKDSSSYYSTKIMKYNSASNTTIVSNYTCVVLATRQKSYSNNNKVVCEINHVGSQPVCHNEVTTAESVSALPSYLDLKFTIKDYQPSMAGKYLIEVHRVTVSKREVVDFETQRSPNHWPLIITLIVIIVIILIGFIGISFYSHAMWVKKHYFAPFESVDEKYTAHLIYHWDNEEEDDENIGLLVQKLNKFITCDLHGSVYDSNKEVELGAKQNILKENLNNCARTIIILSENYIKCDWNNHILYEALKSKIEREKDHVILIKTPQTRIAFRSVDDAVYKTLHRAMKMCTVLEWDGASLGRTFKIELELMMPKLKNEDRQDSSEDGSRTEMFQMNGAK